MTDPSPDQRELIEACEAVAMLPQPIQEDAFEPLADRAIDLIEERGQVLRGEDRISLEALMKYEVGLRRDGYAVAADGIVIMLMVYERGSEVRAAKSADEN